MRERMQQAPIGFCPLQRPKLRKSTDPGFPTPGSFPSRRFSRPQGFAPSEAARACSIPLPLLGFHLQSLPVGGDALAGKPPSCLPHRWLPRPEGRELRSAPHVGWTPRRVPAFRAGGTSVRTARLQPRCPLVSGQAHRRDKALLAARTSLSLLSLSLARQAERSCLAVPQPTRRRTPIEPGWSRPKVRTSRRTLALRRLKASIEPVHAVRWPVTSSFASVGASSSLPSALRRSVQQTRKPTSGRSHVRPAHDPTPTQIWLVGTPPTGGKSKLLP
jgi:hypothetical protein